VIGTVVSTFERMSKPFAPIAILIPCLITIFSPALQAGDLQERFELTRDRVLRGGPPVYDDTFVLADAVPQHVRRFTEFSGDVSGRYIGALAVAGQLEGRSFPELDRIVANVVTLQKADGHFGDPFGAGEIANSDMALLWGNGRLLIGLLEYHRAKPTPAVLACAQRLGDFFVTIAPRLNDPVVAQKFSGDQVAVGYICWTQIIEGLVELHRATKDEKYLQLAGQIAANTHRHPRQHSHGFVTSLRGILDLYRVTRDPKHLQQVEREWEGVIESGNLLPQGALPEVFKPTNQRTEGCAEADWLRLNLGLWAETRKARYLENAELSLFNEFAMNQCSAGDFGHRAFTDWGIDPIHARAWWCCTLHGLRAFPDIFNAVFRGDTRGLCYDLAVEGEGRIEGLTVRADSSLQKDASVTLTVAKSDGEEHAILVRHPAWAAAVEFRLAGQTVTPVEQDGYAKIRRAWKQGDRLQIRYVLQTRRLDQPETKRVAFMRGPWFLGVDEPNSPAFFDEPSQANRILLPIAGGDKQTHLVSEKDSATKPASFSVPVAYLKLRFLPGGYPVQPQTAILRPIAEQTAMGDGTPWILWFDVKP
jgi:DUF1680 family protein